MFTYPARHGCPTNIVTRLMRRVAREGRYGTGHDNSRYITRQPVECHNNIVAIRNGVNRMLHRQAERQNTVKKCTPFRTIECTAINAWCSGDAPVPRRRRVLYNHTTNVARTHAHRLSSSPSPATSGVVKQISANSEYR